MADLAEAPKTCRSRRLTLAGLATIAVLAVVGHFCRLTTAPWVDRPLRAGVAPELLWEEGDRLAKEILERWPRTEVIQNTLWSSQNHCMLFANADPRDVWAVRRFLREWDNGRGLVSVNGNDGTILREFEDLLRGLIVGVIRDE